MLQEGRVPNVTAWRCCLVSQAVERGESLKVQVVEGVAELSALTALKAGPELFSQLSLKVELPLWRWAQGGVEDPTWNLPMAYN